jgi:hypothetical protein
VAAEDLFDRILHVVIKVEVDRRSDDRRVER